MNKKMGATLVLLGFFVGFQLSAAQIQRYEPPKWYFTHFNADCTSNGTRTICTDIRICKPAAASLGIGGWPTVCGFVDNIVPKVCCGYPLILGGALIRRVKAEKERNSYCGNAVWAPKISKTEQEFEKLLRDLPNFDLSDPTRFNPPLGNTTGYVQEPVMGYRYSVQGEFPWMVSIQADGIHQCSGSLIDRTHVLTAAHCFISRRYRLDPSRFSVYAADITNGNTYQVNVTNIILHDKFVPGQYYNDIAILTLEREVQHFNHPICLPSPELSSNDLAGSNTTLLKFQFTSTYLAQMRYELQSVDDMPVVTNEKCRQAYRRVGGSVFPDGVTSDFICAGLEDGRKDACQTDSGGPLMYKNPVGDPTEGWVLVGILVYGYQCSRPGFPAIYTRVSSYMDWISENMKD